MQYSWKMRLALIAGLAWTATATAQEISPQSATDVQPATPAALNTATDRPEPELQQVPKDDNTDETRAIVGDLDAGPGSRWLGDVPVDDPDFSQIEPAMHSAPDGTLFIAVEQYGDQDGWVLIYRSTDGGRNWASLIGFKTGEESRNPSLTYAERNNGDKWLYLAYEATMSDSSKSIIVIRVNPDTLAWNAVAAASGINGTPDIYPRVCTDNVLYDVYYVYVTYTVHEIDYYPVMFTRSLDYGLTYTTPENITGGAENSGFVPRPDIAYGTAGLFVAFEKLGWTGTSWVTQVWATRSTNFGASWATPIQLTNTDDSASRPAIAVAVGVPTVMVAFTQPFADQTDIFCSYSTDSGDSYSTPTPLPRTFDNERDVSLSVSNSEGLYHASFWRDYTIQYTYTDAASPLPWSPEVTVNEGNWASGSHSRNAICVDPTKTEAQEACVAWTDYRGAFYQIYFNAGFIDGACCLPDESCIETNSTGCADAGGVWQGSGVECDAELCLIDPCDEDTLAPISTLDLGDFQCVPYAELTPILGTTGDPEGNLDMWVLEERGMGADPWAVVDWGTTPISGGVLADWGPNAPGYRMLRLITSDTCGHTSTDVRLMYADQGPQATINYPNDGSVISGTAVCIDGLVSHGVCPMEWLLEYRPVGGGWMYLADGIAPVYNLPLTHWDTTLVADGDYELRVSASTVGGEQSHTVGVTVDNTYPTAELTVPTNCEWVTNEIKIEGVASDDNIASWNLQWTGGPSNEWNPIASGTGSASGVLAIWDLSSLPSCAYTIRLIVRDEARNNCTNDAHWTDFLVSINVGDMSIMFDADHDGDVDLYDYNSFMSVFTGPQ